MPQATAQIDMTAWPAPIIRMFQGQMTLDAVYAAADDTDAQKKKGQVCEADFYGGEWSLQQSDEDEAIRLFRLATRECPKTFTEFFAAVQELKGLGAAPQSRQRQTEG